MTLLLNVLRWIIRLSFLVGLTLGFALWAGRGYQYLQAHMWLGFITTFALLLLVIIGFISRLKPILPLISLLWAILLPVIGIAQLRVIPGPNHWIIRVIHLILGIGAIGLAEVLAKRSLLQQRRA